MKVDPALIDVMRVTEIRMSDFVRQEVEARKHGSIRYRPRAAKPATTPDETVSRIGDTRIGSLMLSHVSDRLGMEVAFPEGHPYAFCVMLVLNGAVHCRPFKADAGTTARAGHVLLGQTEPGAEALTTDCSERLNLWINRRSLLRCLEMMLDRPLDTPLTFAPEEAWPRGSAASLQRLVRYVANELIDPYSLFAGGVGVVSFEDLISRTILEGTIHSYTERLARMTTTAPPRAIGRAMDFMRANIFQPLTVADIAQEAGCSARALAASFRSERGQTVTAVLRDLRLEAAREAILAGDPDLTINAVCTRFGFSNPGRFSNMYRERFGVLPAHAQRERRNATVPHTH